MFVLLLAIQEPAFAYIPILMVTILAVSLVLFHSLTVEVTRHEILLRFGIGLIRKSYAVADVQSVSAVRIRWWHGWGIHYTPAGWLYNVSGFDAVELQFTNGRKVRIGTDEPQKLQNAIAAVIRE